MSVIREAQPGKPYFDMFYLKLDQTTLQTVINGAPQFDEGITIKEDKWIYLDGV